jgi:hypothetical protein
MSDSDFLAGLLRSPGNIRISRSDLKILTEHLLERPVFDFTDEQHWHLETIRLYNLGMYNIADREGKDRTAEQKDSDRSYLEAVRSINRGRCDMARRHDTNKFFDRLYATDKGAATNHIPDDGMPAVSERQSSTKPPAPERVSRLETVVDGEKSHFLLDGKPIPTPEVAVSYVARLIKANGERVSFTEWLESQPAFQGETSNRVFKKIPSEVMQFIDWPGKGGRSPRIKTELLCEAPNI